METWEILTISLVAAIILGLGGGIAVGKYMVKRAKSPRKPLLSKRERIVYSMCILLGTALILFGVFFPFPTPGAGMGSDDALVLDDGNPETNPEDGEGNTAGAGPAAKETAVAVIGGSDSIAVRVS